MNVKFEANRLKPDDPNFVWDKRADFKPTESNEWDEDEDD